jgi:hypothetical protein
VQTHLRTRKQWSLLRLFIVVTFVACALGFAKLSPPRQAQALTISAVFVGGFSGAALAESRFGSGPASARGYLLGAIGAGLVESVLTSIANSMPLSLAISAFVIAVGVKEVSQRERFDKSQTSLITADVDASPTEPT